MIFVFSILRVLAVAFSLLYIKKVRRVPLYMGCLAICAVGQFILAAHFIFNLEGRFNEFWSGFAWLPIVGIAVFYTGFCCGVGQVTIYISGEIIPANARGIGSGLVSVTAGLLKFGWTAGVPTMQEYMGTGISNKINHFWGIHNVLSAIYDFYFQ